MSESLKIIKRNHYPVRVRLSAVRDRLINELDYAEVLTKYGVSSSTFGNWLKKYKPRVMSEESYKRLSLSFHDPKTLLSMTDKERQELEHLRAEVEKQKVLVEAYELMLELAKGRLHYGEMLSAGLLNDKSPVGEIDDGIPVYLFRLQQAGLLQKSPFV